jgi:Phage tail sheath C-terminal domain
LTEDEEQVGKICQNIIERCKDSRISSPFLQNDSEWRRSVRSTLQEYMTELKAYRTVSDYAVVCDETNNTIDMIDNMEKAISVYFRVRIQPFPYYELFMTINSKGLHVEIRYTTL